MSRRRVKTSLNMSLNDWIFISGHDDSHRVPKGAQDCSIKRGKRYTIYREPGARRACLYSYDRRCLLIICAERGIDRGSSRRNAGCSRQTGSGRTHLEVHCRARRQLAGKPHVADGRTICRDPQGRRRGRKVRRPDQGAERPVSPWHPHAAGRERGRDVRYHPADQHGTGRQRPPRHRARHHPFAGRAGRQRRTPDHRRVPCAHEQRTTVPGQSSAGRPAGLVPG